MEINSANMFQNDKKEVDTSMTPVVEYHFRVDICLKLAKFKGNSEVF